MVQVTPISRAYRTRGDRARARAQLIRRGYNYFVEYQEASVRQANGDPSPALQYGVAAWVRAGSVYTCR